MLVVKIVYEVTHSNINPKENHKKTTKQIPKPVMSQPLNDIMEVRWPSGRASDSGARGRGSSLTQVAMLRP